MIEKIAWDFAACIQRPWWLFAAHTRHLIAKQYLDDLDLNVSEFLFANYMEL